MSNEKLQSKGKGREAVGSVPPNTTRNVQCNSSQLTHFHTLERRESDTGEGRKIHSDESQMNSASLKQRLMGSRISPSAPMSARTHIFQVFVAASLNSSKVVTHLNSPSDSI